MRLFDRNGNHLTNEEKASRLAQAEATYEHQAKKRLKTHMHRLNEQRAREQREHRRYWKSITEFDPNQP